MAGGRPGSSVSQLLTGQRPGQGPSAVRVQFEERDANQPRPGSCVRSPILNTSQPSIHLINSRY